MPSEAPPPPAKESTINSYGLMLSPNDYVSPTTGSRCSCGTSLCGIIPSVGLPCLRDGTAAGEQVVELVATVDAEEVEQPIAEPLWLRARRAFLGRDVLGNGWRFALLGP